MAARVSSMACLAALTLTTWLTPGAAGREHESPLRITARPLFRAADSVQSGATPLHFELELERGPGFGTANQIEIRALYRRPGGAPTPVTGACAGSPFSVANPRDREVVVALHSTFNELRVFDLAGSQFQLTHSINLPNRIEAIDLDDADNDGAVDIVVGLAGSTTPNQLRIFRYDVGSDSFVEELISGTLPLHIEDIEVGDADNDGQNEIVVALERISSGAPSNVARVLLFEYVNGAWMGPVEVSPPEALSAQDVAIGDVDNDGDNEIAVLFANVVSSESPGRQARVYENVGGQWVRDDVTSLVTSGLTRAERLIVANVDGAAGNEILTAYWSGPSPYSGELVALRFDGVDWNEETIDDTVGIIDSLDAGDFDGDDFVDLAAGTGVLNSARVRYYERVGGAWTVGNVSGSVSGGIIWDVDIDDPDNDFCSEILAATDSTLRVFEPGSTSPVASESFSVDIDSAQVADVDFDGTDARSVQDLLHTGRSVRPFSIAIAPTVPAGTTWELLFEVRARVVNEDGRNVEVVATSAPTRVRIAP